MNKDKELLLLQRELDRAYDRLIDVEYENSNLHKTIELYEWRATIEAWDEEWLREERVANNALQLSLPFGETAP